MEQLTTTAQESGISAELKDFIDQVIVPALLQKLQEEQDSKVVGTNEGVKWSQ
jgi:hypothetical protein